MEDNRRLQSIDALRGLDMFFIMGGQMLFASFAILLPCAFTEGVAIQMEHVAWEGFRFYDMIFPLFLFIAGISFPFSYSKQLAAGKSMKKIYLNILRRAVILIIFGLVYNGLLNFDFAGLRYPSVLGRIGLGWALAAVIYINFKTKARLIISVAILLGYWALIALIPAPDMPGAGVFSLEGNIVGYIDRNILPGTLYLNVFDPEGLLSTLPAICTGLLGMFAGDMVRGAGTAIKETRAVLWMSVAGGALIATGLLWNYLFPINKSLWSSSFVCLVGGISFLLFALFYYVIDVLRWRKWAFFLP